MDNLTLNLAVLKQKRIENTKLGVAPYTDEQMQWFEEEILKGWNEKNIEDVLGVLGNGYALWFVADNTKTLLSMGCYESALLSSYQGTRVNNMNFSKYELNYLFSLGDPDKFIAAGDPLPEKESYTLYRGVSGKGRNRRVSGHSWTGSIEIARWFANRFEHLENPAVYKITASKKCIITYTNEREEDEYVLRLPLFLTPRKVEG